MLKTYLNKYCLYLTRVLYKIPIYHALFCYLFSLFWFECLQDQGIKFSTRNQSTTLQIKLEYKC